MGRVSLDRHFDAVALLEAVQKQPYGLAISTNHPPGFRRITYLASRKKPALRCQILQSPKSRNLFLLVPNHVDINAVAIEHQAEQTAEAITTPESTDEQA